MEDFIEASMKCHICNAILKDKPTALSQHLRTHNITTQQYFDTYLGGPGRCTVCDGSTTFHNINKGYFKTCGAACRAKVGWQKDDGSRKQANRERFTANNPSIGRPKGSKNKNPYPKVTRRSVSRPYNRDLEKISKCQQTWIEKTDVQIIEMVQKQQQTRLENGTMATRYHQGKYKLKKPKKYRGDVDNVVYRSSWERAVFVWCERNDEISQWSSEEIVIGYYSDLDKRAHRYFVDVLLTYKDGTTKLVEIKPAKETQPPVKPTKKTKRYLTEAFTFVKNQNKWKAAEEYAKDRGWSFEIWTEDVLQAKGILPKQLKGLKKIKPLPQPKLKKKMSDTKPFPRMNS